MEKSSLRYISTIEDYSPVSEASRELANFKQNTHVPIYSVKYLSVCDKLWLLIEEHHSIVVRVLAFGAGGPLFKSRRGEKFNG